MNRLTPLFWLSLSFSLGIFLKTHSQTKFFLAFSFLLLVSLFLIKPKFRPVFFAILIFLVLGWIRASGYYSLKQFEGKTVEVEGEVERSGNHYFIFPKHLIFKNRHYRVAGKAHLRGFGTHPFRQGEKVILKSKLTKNDNNYFILMNPVIIKKTESWYQHALVKIKNRARLFFKENLPPEEANFITSSLFGRLEIDLSLYGFFQKAGVAHLLAISGLHVGFLFLFLFSIFSFLPRLSRYCLSFSLLFFYAALADLTPSVIRASLMLLISFITLELGRTQQIINNLSLACFIMLLFNPFLLYSLSFQLSTLAVAGIGFFKPLLDKFVSIYPENLKSLINITLSAQLGTLILVIYVFGNFPLISLLSNLLIIPLFSLAISIAFLAFALSFFASFLTIPLMPFLFIVARTIILIVKFLSFFPSLSSTLATTIFLVLFLVLALKNLLKQEVKISLFSLFTYYLLIFSLLLWYYSLSIYFQPLTVTFLNVGQGDACLIQLPQGQNLLIDGGASNSLLLKNLNSLPIRKIDAVILSHPHHDHIGGLYSLPDKLKIWEFYSQPYPRSEEFQKLISRYHQAKVKIHLTKSITAFRLTEGTIEFIPFFLDNDPNESPLTAIIKTGKFSFLFPGDAEKEAQTWLIKKLKPATVLKLPHHGSFLLPEFLRKVKPKIGIICLGKSNQYGHPKKEVISLLKKEGIQVYRTDESGWIRIRKEGKHLTLTPQFPGN